MCSSTDNDGFYGTVSEAQRLGYNVSKMNEWTDKGETGINEWYKMLLDRNIDKQQANLILSPFAYTTCIISGTEWNRFFDILCPKYITENKLFYSKKQTVKELEITGSSTGLEFDFDFNWQSINKSTAQPEFQVIAEMLYDLYQEADWKENKYHIPFEEEIKKLYDSQIVSLMLSYIPVDFDIEKEQYVDVYDDFVNANIEEYYKILMKISASMCAKLSYNTQDNEDTLEKHLERANMLIESKHYEPFAHQSVVMGKADYNYSFYKSMVKHIDNGFGKERTIVKELGWCYNLRGFVSQRYILENY